MTFINFTQVRLIGEEPEVVTLSRLCIKRDVITSCFELWDKHDMVIRGILCLRDDTGGQALVKANFDDVVETLKEVV